MNDEKKLADFQRKGFQINNFKANNAYYTLKKVLSEIKNDKIKNNYYLESKYLNTLDLRPDVNSYNSCFLDLLIENNIYEKINFLTQRKMELAHIQLRISKPGNSYMPWHKDTYSYTEKSSGLVPAPIKLIYYYPFCEKEKEETKLQILEGSHRCELNNLPIQYQISPGFNLFDKDVAMKNLKCVNFTNNEFQYLLFDTSCLHNVTSAEYESVRVIYTFCTEYQFYKTFGSEKNKNKENHIKTFTDYRKRNEKS